MNNLTKSNFDITNFEPRQVVCINDYKNDWSFDDKASEFLKIGQIYTVIEVDPHSWHTRVRLNEFPDRQFHSVRFNEVKPGPYEGVSWEDFKNELFEQS